MDRFVIPAQAGIQNFNASRIYRKKPKPFRRHSHESGNLETKNYRDLSETTNPLRHHSRKSGNLEMKSNRNLSEMTETERTGFPLLRE
ncbi:hypothetical protein [Neisseria meningitidis]|uniref:hypothetical protein n=1 Tax=Neisseria meningitidis TaxID=487 RepID=UPI001641566A|nr:hypothetical protein [Neisseria meningitidis]